jgi:hypothetical protein
MEAWEYLTVIRLTMSVSAIDLENRGENPLIRLIPPQPLSNVKCRTLNNN